MVPLQKLLEHRVLLKILSVGLNSRLDGDARLPASAHELECFNGNDFVSLGTLPLQLRASSAKLRVRPNLAPAHLPVASSLISSRNACQHAVYDRLAASSIGVATLHSKQFLKVLSA